MREGSSLFRHYRSLRLPLSPKTQKSTENRCFFHTLTEIRCRQNFPFFLTGEAQHIDMPYLEVPVRFNMPIYAFLHNVLLVRKLNPHTKLQCSKTGFRYFVHKFVFNIHTKLQCSKTSNRGASSRFVKSGNSVQTVYNIISEYSLSIKIFFSANNFLSLCVLSTKINPILFLKALR